MGRAASARSECKTRRVTLPLLQLSSDVDVSLFWIVLATLAAPILGHVTHRILPEVVVLLGLGVVIGPSTFGLAHAESLDVLKQLGLGLLFLSAGFEIDTDELRGRQVRRAGLTWIVSLALAIALALLALRDRPWLSAVALAIALSSTALGTLLPILREKGLLGTALGTSVLAHGAIGELGPVAAMALLLSGNGPWIGAVVLIGFALLTVLLAWLTRRHVPRVTEKVVAAATAHHGPDVDEVRAWFVTTGQHKLTQGLLRAVMVLLTGLMALAAVFDIDVALGAFMSGLCLRLVVGDATESLGQRIDVLANSFFIPVFFVMSGMAINLADVGAEPWVVVAAFVIVLVTRGIPVWLAERFTDTGSGLTTIRDRVQLALYASAGLPIIVAVTEVAVNQKLMGRDIASCLVAAGALTVLVFPLLANWVGAREQRSVRTVRS